MNIDTVKTHETRYRGVLTGEQLGEIVRAAVMAEAGINSWTAGVTLTLRPATILTGGDTIAVEFEMVVDHDVHLKPKPAASIPLPHQTRIDANNATIGVLSVAPILHKMSIRSDRR